MSGEELDLVGVAERFLATIEDLAAGARTTADVRGDPKPIAGLVDRAFASTPNAGVLRDPNMRAELSRRHPALDASIAAWLSLPLAKEGAIRAAISASTVLLEGAQLPLHRALARYRHHDETKRRGARAVLDPALEKIFADYGVEAWAEKLDATATAPAPPAPAPPRKAPAAPAKGIVLASPDLVAALTGAGPALDLRTAEKLVVETVGSARPTPEARRHAEIADAARAIAESGGRIDPDIAASIASQARASETRAGERAQLASIAALALAAQAVADGDPEAAPDLRASIRQLALTAQALAASAKEVSVEVRAALGAMARAAEALASGSRVGSGTRASLADLAFSARAAAESGERIAPVGASSAAPLAADVGASIRDLAATARELTGIRRTESGAGGDRALADLARAFAEGVSGSVPSSFGAWRSVASGAGVADFRPAREVSLTALAESAHALPFEQPLVPLARQGAVVVPDLDAYSTIGHLVGLGVLAGDAAIGAALAFMMPSRPFLERGLRDRPSDRLRASRSIGLALAFMYLDALASMRAAGSAEAFRDYHQDLLGAAPPASIAAFWAIEHRCARLLGERPAIYLHGGERMVDALLRGLSLAIALREAFDEDWFRNPRATTDRLLEHASAITRAAESTLTDWLRDAVRS